MSFIRRRQSAFRLSLILVGWVILVCLAKNTGIMNLCSINYLDDSITVSQPFEVDEDKCDLSEQLLCAHQHQMDSPALISFVFVLAFISWLLATPNNFPPFTEPIVHKRRVHLQICVFRE